MESARDLADDEHGDVVVEGNAQAAQPGDDLPQVPAVDVLHDRVVHRVAAGPTALPEQAGVSLNLDHLGLQPVHGDQVRVVEQNAELDLL